MSEKQLKKRFRVKRKKMLKQLKCDQKVEPLRHRVNMGHPVYQSFYDTFDKFLMWMNFVLAVLAFAEAIFVVIVLVYKLTHWFYFD